MRCKFCFSHDPVKKPMITGSFHTPLQVFNALTKAARKKGYKLISASASEGTLGKRHLFELLEFVDKSDFVYVLETNGITLGNDPEFCKQLSRFKNLHVRVSIKGCSQEEFHILTSAKRRFYEFPYKALDSLIENKVSCNACLSISFSKKNDIDKAKQKLYNIAPGILKSLELEYITLFPKVLKELNKYKLKPNKVRQFGKIIKV